jgi:hypothetical protein
MLIRRNCALVVFAGVLVLVLIVVVMMESFY